MSTKIIFVNAAPRAGKDTAAQIITSTYHNTYRIGFADHLKKATHAAYGLFDVPFSYFENEKENPNPLFFGISPRQAYINHSEKYMKPLHGDKVFGTLWMRAAEQLKDPDMIVISDSGFASEAEPVIEKYGAENCLLLRILRDGCDFKNDSRSHIELPNITMKTIKNNGTIGDFRYKIIEEVNSWLNQGLSLA